MTSYWFIIFDTIQKWSTTVLISVLQIGFNSDLFILDLRPFLKYEF